MNVVARGIEQQIEDLIAPTLEAMGYLIVCVRLFTDDGVRVQVMIERQDGSPVTVGDCEQASESASALLDIEDVFDNAWNLELSSPGIERPLIKLSDWERFAGYRIQVTLEAPVEGRRKFQCVCRGVNDGNICLGLDNGETMELPLSAIQSAHIVLTEALMRQALRTAKHAGEKKKEHKRKRKSRHILH